mmetsp:Transcript_10833/g.32896  ORF Transcript_10833/g.32896 Transcript_10833/m.32896 type:complete len:187 (-) Transcript_10833:519-1079(-)
MGNAQNLLFQDEEDHREKLFEACGPEGDIEKVKAAEAYVKRNFVDKDLEFEAVMEAMHDYWTRPWPKENNVTPMARASQFRQIEVHTYIHAKIQECERIARNVAARDTDVKRAKTTLFMKNKARDFGIARRDVGQNQPLSFLRSNPPTTSASADAADAGGDARDDERVSQAKSRLASFQSSRKSKK